MSDIYEQFDEIDQDIRMLCIDAAAVACYLYQQGQQAAGIKLLHTVVTTAGLESAVIQKLLDNLPKSVNSLATHAEIRALINNFSG